MPSITSTHQSSSKPLSRPGRALSLRLPTTRDDVAAAAIATSSMSKHPRRQGHRRRARICAPRRAGFLLALFTGCLFIVGLCNIRRLPPPTHSFHQPSPLPPPDPTPPLPVDKGLHAIAVWEQDLPENKLASPQAGTRYIRFLNENWGVGFNNQLQEIILHAHLAYWSNRTYVLPPLNFPHSDDWHPLAAFVRGAFAGSPSSTARHDMHAITRDHFLNACPDWETAPSANYSALAARFSPEFAATSAELYVDNAGDYATLMAQDVNDLLGLETDPAGDALLDGWTRVLEGMPQRCITIHKESTHVFDYNLFGTERVQSLMPSLLRSPVLQDLQWSDLVHGAVERNLRTWGWISPEPENGTADAAELDTYAPLSRVLALHLRRGDYRDHCEALSTWGSSFLGVNDAFVRNEDRNIDLDRKSKTPEQRAEFAKHCWPEMDDIIARVKTIRTEWDALYAETQPRNAWDSFWEYIWPQRSTNLEKPRLDRLYILTNGDSEWYNMLRARLHAEGGWDVRGSPDMDFIGAEGMRAESERVVAQAVDMAVGVRAEVFVGNGFSSLTANVNLLRAARGSGGRSIQFW